MRVVPKLMVLLEAKEDVRGAGINLDVRLDQGFPPLPAPVTAKMPIRRVGEPTVPRKSTEPSLLLVVPRLMVRLSLAR